MNQIKTYSLQPDSIRNLFDAIAPTYDLLNDLLSLKRDHHWRKMTVKELNGLEGWVLDLATGTGNVAIEISHQKSPTRKILGLDFSYPMIKRAKKKILQRGLSEIIELSLGDALSLPFRNNTFSASIIAFGLRNIAQKEQALSEMARVIKKGGKVIVLEFTFPQKEPMRSLYSIYFQRVLPRVGGLISGNRGAYEYLPKSVLEFASPKNYEEMMRKIGLEHISSRSLTGGVTSIISGIKK